MNKLLALVVIWLFVGIAYLAMAVAMPAINQISTRSAADMIASANMSNQPGVVEAVQSSPAWLWVIPGVIGIVVTAVTLRKGKRR